MRTIKHHYTAKLNEILEQEVKQQKDSLIFVFQGISPYINIADYYSHLIDNDTFEIEGGLDIFNVMWAMTSGMKLMQQSDYLILSYPQFCNLKAHMATVFAGKNVVIIRDNLRSIFPLNENLYTEESGVEDISNRSVSMPNYQAEQMTIGNRTYYSIQGSEMYKVIDLHTETLPLNVNCADYKGIVIDASTDTYAIDLFVNQCLENASFNKTICVRTYRKQIQREEINHKLQLLNHLLYLHGGSVIEICDEVIQSGYIANPQTETQLKMYWGKKAQFRNLLIYANPDVDKTVISVPQSLVVDTIKSECENALAGKEVRDIFLTAPTGAGKSLLFQLSAFHVAARNEVTLVISPLIALMKDQVEAIKKDRKFNRVCYLNSELTALERETALADCREGKIDILYLSPELLLSYNLSYFVGQRRVGLMVIDEAHLVTTWGRDFRVDYWYLGTYINKVRKSLDYKFPLAAFTATAVYGGAQDMVFDAIDSLMMHNPHKFIGQVRRNDISFCINNYDKFSGKYDDAKLAQTVEFIKSIHQSNRKTIVYVPYVTQAKRISLLLQSEGLGDIASIYYGSMDADQKELAICRFKSGECKIIICTKAFGMGVDISDIEIVYHHAPSGLLPDYIQEIGRAARDPKMKGFACLNYLTPDQRYSHCLHGLSSLSNLQLQEVLKKIMKIFKDNSLSRNLLVSAEDFAYIFDGCESSQLSQKVQTAFMLLEKDYLAKARYNAFLARPKKLFTKVYAVADAASAIKLQSKFGNMCKELCIRKGTDHIFELELNKIWETLFKDMSFPKIKSEFYRGHLLDPFGINIKPVNRLELNLHLSLQAAIVELKSVLDSLQSAFVSLRGHFFNRQILEELLSSSIPDTKVRSQFVSFILNSFTTDIHYVETDAFLQKRLRGDGQSEYNLIAANEGRVFNGLIRLLDTMFSESEVSVRYTECNSYRYKQISRLGALLDILGLGSFTSRGGENPMIFVRINDPERLQRDAENAYYSNKILQATMDRYKVSTAQMDWFFTHSWSDQVRWEIIENIFLGEDLDDLRTKYNGDNGTHVDIVQYIERNANPISLSRNRKTSEQAATFPPSEGKKLFLNTLLTIGHETQTVSRWIAADPVALHQAFRIHHMQLMNDVFRILIPRLRDEHKSYWRDIKGLNIDIKIPVKGSEISVRSAYDTEPIAFYKWWVKKENANKVAMTNDELRLLLIKVQTINPKALHKKHQEQLSRLSA